MSRVLTIYFALFAASCVIADDKKPIAIGGRLAKASKIRPVEAPNGPRFATVIRQSLDKSNKNSGFFRGALLGNGTVNLALQIIKNDSVVSSRYIGKIPLTTRDKETPFAFKAPIPGGKNWSWRIVATVV